MASQAVFNLYKPARLTVYGVSKGRCLKLKLNTKNSKSIQYYIKIMIDHLRSLCRDDNEFEKFRTATFGKRRQIEYHSKKTIRFLKK